MNPGFLFNYSGSEQSVRRVNNCHCCGLNCRRPEALIPTMDGRCCCLAITERLPLLIYNRAVISAINNLLLCNAAHLRALFIVISKLFTALLTL